jgi:hypothetical protein
MSDRSSGVVLFNCGFDHSQLEPCHGKHEAEIILHNVSDTVTIRVDDETLIISDEAFCALETCIEKLKRRLMNNENRITRLERLLLELVQALMGKAGGVDEKGNAVMYENELFTKIEKELKCRES